MGAFEGKLVVVAGGGHIGEECVRWFLKAGATVAMLDAGASATRSELGEVGDRYVAFDVELDDWDGIAAHAERWHADRGRLDVLVNAQRIVDMATIEDATVDATRHVLEVNLIGPIVCSRSFLPSLKASDQAAIVNIGSIDGFHGFHKVASYSMSKGAMVPLTHVMARQFAPYGIRANCVAVGSDIADPEAARRAPNPIVDVDRILDVTLLKRMGRAEEFANVVGFLAAPQASFMTGSIVTVDGGRSAITPGLH